MAKQEKQKTTSEKEEEIKILQEILKWIKISSHSQVKDVLNTVLKTETEKMIYHFSNGENSTMEVVKKAKSSSQKVSDCWKEWKQLGIGESVKAKGGERFKRTFDLNDFGLLKIK